MFQTRYKQPLTNSYLPILALFVLLHVFESLLLIASGHDLYYVSVVNIFFFMVNGYWFFFELQQSLIWFLLFEAVGFLGFDSIRFVSR